MNSLPSHSRARIQPEYLAYAAAFVFALILRLVGAGQTLLTDREAELALQSLALARGQATLLGPHPLYLMLTTVWFSIFAATDWTARFWPALAGSLLVLLPALYRDRLGKLPAVLLAVLLALDPGLLAISRQAGSPSLAVFLTLLALGLWLKRRASLAGIAAGLALLGGPAIWPGVMGLLIAAWVSGGMGPARAAPVEDESQPGPALARPFIFAALLSLFFAGTLFFFLPNGLSAIGSSLSGYLVGWGSGSGLSISLFLLALLLYEFFPLLFGLWNGIGSLFTKNEPLNAARRIDHFLLTWWLAALLLALIYPARQGPDLAWSLIPLWALAARQIARLRLPAYDRLPVLGQAALAGVIFGYVSMGLVTITNAPPKDLASSWLQIAAALAMLAASAGLIAWGWSRQVALRGVTLALGLVLGIYTLAAGWNTAGLAGRASAEFWTGGSTLRDANLILSTLKNLDQWGPQQAGGPGVVVSGVPSPALRWLLRNVEQVSYETVLSTTSSPAIVITAFEPQLSLASTYRGEAFVLDETVNWRQASLADWFRWEALRILPGTLVQQKKIILWARADLFPGGSVQTNPVSQPSTK